MANLGQIANDIFYYEFDADTNEVNISVISGWLNANIGELNNLIYTSHSGTGINLNTEEQDIFKHLYLAHYYKKKSRNAIKTIGTANAVNNIVSVSDEDSSVSFINGNEVSKQFRALSKDHLEELNKLVYAYNSYQSPPAQVIGKSMMNDVLFLSGTGFLNTYIRY
jgi:hypothetical protein